jgi:hypothetical protein
MKLVISLILALPQLVKAILEINKFYKDVTGQTPRAAVKKTSEVFKKLNDAKTHEERQAVAKDIQDLIAKL